MSEEDRDAHVNERRTLCHGRARCSKARHMQHNQFGIRDLIHKTETSVEALEKQIKL